MRTGRSSLRATMLPAPGGVNVLALRLLGCWSRVRHAPAGKDPLADACRMIDNDPDRSGSFSPAQFLLGCPTPEAPPASLS